MNPTVDFLAQYLKPKREQKRHEYYHESVEYAEQMLIHFDGLKPGKLLSERRPAESPEIHKFRQIIFKSKTRAYCDKITNSLLKIRKSQDWMIKYSNDNDSKVRPEESLQRYMEKSFPRYESFTNWYFSIAFKVYLTDTNSLCLWKPLNEDVKDNEYYKPYPFIFKSRQVVDYVYHEWYLLHSDEKNMFMENGTQREGFIYYYVDSEGIYTIRQINMAGGYSVDEFIHGLGYCPIVDFGGVIQAETMRNYLRQSRVYGIVPSFDEAVREYSDLQAEVVQHIHSTMWAHAGQDCKACKGAGMVPRKDAPAIKCKECKGKGTVPFNPYEYFEIPRPKAGEAQVAGVPLGYVTKQIEIAELQNTRVKDHIKDGMSAINMEWIVDPPQLAQSGISKEVDKDDMHTFFHVIAEDIIRFCDRCYMISCDYRYKFVVADVEERYEMLPMIPVPEKYDILSETYLVQEIKMLKDAGIAPEIINSALKEYAEKKFFADPDSAKLISNILDIDPLSSHGEDNIITQLTNDGIEQVDYIIHCNIRQFVNRAVEENEGFYEMELSERKEIIKGYADAVVTANSAKGKIIQMADAGGDDLGKIPLAMQQLALARERARTVGDADLEKSIGTKMDELLNNI